MRLSFSKIVEKMSCTRSMVMMGGVMIMMGGVMKGGVMMGGVMVQRKLQTEQSIWTLHHEPVGRNALQTEAIDSKKYVQNQHMHKISYILLPSNHSFYLQTSPPVLKMVH